MGRRIWLGLAMVAALGLSAQKAPDPAPPPSQAEKELQAPYSLDDGKPTQGQRTDAGPSALRAFGSLVLVLGLVSLSLWALKKYGRGRLPGGGHGKLKVEETLALGDRRFVSILDAEGERFLIALSPQGIALLARLDGLEQANGEKGFEQALAQQGDLGRPMPVKEMEALLKQSGGGQ
ncbi:MAG: flagellar biosynthetic protein FliO [Acidobacteriota bacterium]|nr:flagellar biosynthetic protein FliO [Acidobacteriota bacterium]